MIKNNVSLLILLSVLAIVLSSSGILYVSETIWGFMAYMTLVLISVVIAVIIIGFVIKPRSLTHILVGYLGIITATVIFWGIVKIDSAMVLGCLSSMTLGYWLVAMMQLEVKIEHDKKA